ncbi:MAG: hypothetical protein CMP49_04975 [Flavobacteriales bacterium]|nr:hypothetical protein [Flavobacteriales bacterium]|tara:strand:+ start:18443 stop:19270 length:828 start_codon:yes stop_codon:yes gene_type:complete
MILSKIKKHLSIFCIRLNQKRELNKIKEEKNPYLNIIVKSFLEVKLNKKLNDHLEVFKLCERYRKNLLKDDRIITYEIFGLSKKIKVKEICKKATSSPIWAQFLYLIIDKLSTPFVLEIGTNLGVSGTYILSAIKNKKNSFFITMEGVPALCKIAQSQFSSIASKKKFQIIQGLYNNTFPKLIAQNLNFNILFIDGNHRKNDTLYYFNSLISNKELQCIMIFDDINWSAEMQECWSIIRKNPIVSYSINYYKWGIIIIDQSTSKFHQHFYFHLDY